MLQRFVQEENCIMRLRVLAVRRAALDPGHACPVSLCRAPIWQHTHLRTSALTAILISALACLAYAQARCVRIRLLMRCREQLSPVEGCWLSAFGRRRINTCSAQVACSSQSFTSEESESFAVSQHREDIGVGARCRSAQEASISGDERATSSHCRWQRKNRNRIYHQAAGCWATRRGVSRCGAALPLAGCEKCACSLTVHTSARVPDAVGAMLSKLWLLNSDIARFAAFGCFCNRTVHIDSCCEGVLRGATGGSAPSVNRAKSFYLYFIAL